MKKTLYIDTDCAARYEDQKGAGHSPLSFEPGLFQYLSRISNDLDYALVLCVPGDLANFPIEELKRFCKGENIVFEEVVNSTALTQRLRYNKNEEQVLICRPSFSDRTFFEKASIYVANEESVLSSQNVWADIYKNLSSNQRKATVVRKTSETDIQCYLNLDGSGQNEISTGLGFFDHMLQQIARHGNIDMHVKVQGDLHIDEHHTIEDVGLALGAAFNEALGNKKGIERYGFLLPMDDCLAQVGLDFGGRPWLVWDVDFKREKIGDMPTEMFHHFFKSFSDTAKCNLNIKAEGSNEHHKIESIFKAFSKSIAMAISKNNSNSVPSTKGSL